jgi:putative modified peptide
VSNFSVVDQFNQSKNASLTLRKNQSAHADDSVLTDDQTLLLLRKLASDDDFRTLFESKPAKALFDMGVPPEQIVNLNAWCLFPSKLAGKKLFEDAVAKLRESVLDATSRMTPPKMRGYN